MNDRFKFRVWDKGNEQYLNLSEVDYLTLDTENGGLIIGFLDELMTEMTYMPEKDMVVEQCTGIKDKNGNLIYEGDILDCELQDIASHGYPFIHFKKGVVKRAKNGAYCVEGDDDFYASDITLYPIEIIGNIHEQPEQKDK